jgi:DNA-binding transcriptional MerR regulator
MSAPVPNKMGHPENEMGRQEAAKFLGVTVRTLHNLVKSHALACAYRKGTTRDIVVYQREDLERIKAERLAPSLPKDDTNNLNHVQFRVNDHDYKALKQGAKRHDMSPNSYARSLVNEGLALREELSALRADYLKVTDHLAESQEAQQTLQEQLAQMHRALSITQTTLGTMQTALSTVQTILHAVKDNQEGDFEAVCHAFQKVLQLSGVSDYDAAQWVTTCLKGETTTTKGETTTTTTSSSVSNTSSSVSNTSSSVSNTSSSVSNTSSSASRPASSASHTISSASNTIGATVHQGASTPA